jgi:hypothetical protein
MTRNTHTVIHKVGGEYVRKIVPADLKFTPILLDRLVEALQAITVLSNDDEVVIRADRVLEEYYDQYKS